jgi:hypothetical protein
LIWRDFRASAENLQKNSRSSEAFLQACRSAPG